MESRKKLVDIRNMQRQIFFDTLSGIRKENPKFKFVLVIDEKSLPIISGVVSTTELIENGIVLTERYELKRKPYPSFQAIYLLDEVTSVQQFITDFSGSGIYAGAHLLFTTTCSSSNMSLLKDKPDVVNHVLSFIDLYIAYRVLEPMTFITPTFKPLNSMYSKTGQFDMFESQAIRGLVSFFSTINSVPDIAIPKGNDKLETTKNLFTEILKNSMEASEKRVSRDDTLLILFPRHFDQLAPLIHSFTYQSMIYEHLNVQNETISVEIGKDNEVVIPLNPYEDEIYAKCAYYFFDRFKDIADYALKEKEATAILDDKDADRTSEEFQKALKLLLKNPKKQNVSNAHFKIATDLSDIVDSQKLADPVAILEQRISTGVSFATEEGQNNKDYKPKLNDLQTVCITEGPSGEDKLRVIATYVASGQSITPTNLNRLLESSKLNPERYSKCIENIKLLGKSPSRKSVFDPEEELGFVADKYFPYAAQVTLDAINNKMDKKVWDFPQHAGRYNNIIVYFMGGVSFTELNKFDLIRNRTKGSSKIFVGATNTITPMQFLTQIKNLE